MTSADGPIAFPLRLADGRVVDAGDLRLGQLWAEMKRLNVPGITAEMGKYELLQIYRDWLSAESSRVLDLKRAV